MAFVKIHVAGDNTLALCRCNFIDSSDVHNFFGNFIDMLTSVKFCHFAN